MVLIQNMKDMVGFLLILLALIVFFAVAFLMLFGGDLDALTEAGASAHESYTASVLTSNTAISVSGFESFALSLMSTARMGMFGDFDFSVFNRAAHPEIARFLFFVFVLVVGVVALNALIALLSDSYAQVQEQQTEQSLRLLAALVIGARFCLYCHRSSAHTRIACVGAMHAVFAAILKRQVVMI